MVGRNTSFGLVVGLHRMIVGLHAGCVVGGVPVGAGAVGLGFPLPAPPDGGALLCARSGAADNAIAKAQNAAYFRKAIPGWLPMAIIDVMLILFYAVSTGFLQIMAGWISEPGRARRDGGA